MSATISQADYARAAGLTRARVSQLVSAGMPLTSRDAADRWRAQNVKGTVRREAKAAVLDVSKHDAGGIQTPDGPYRPPEASEPAIERARVTDEGPAGAYERQRQIERAAYALAAKALREQSAHAKHLVAVHAQAARNLAVLKIDVLAAAEKERSLVSGDWVKRVMTEHDGALVTLIKAMPKQLSGRISPHDPEHAEAELTRWVQEVFLKTIYTTNPFTSEKTNNED